VLWKSVFKAREFVEAGGLVSYGVDVPHNGELVLRADRVIE
jgi:hypothetical protein